MLTPPVRSCCWVLNPIEHRNSDMGGVGYLTGKGSYPDVSYNSANEEYLVVWTDTEPTSQLAAAHSRCAEITQACNNLPRPARSGGTVHGPRSAVMRHGAEGREEANESPVDAGIDRRR